MNKSIFHLHTYLFKEVVPHKMIIIAINTLQFDSITPEEADLGHVTCKKLN